MLFQLDQHDSAWKQMQQRHQFHHLNAAKRGIASQSALTSVGWLGGVGLRVAPPPPDPALHPEGAALVVEPSPLLEGAEQLVQRLREVRG